MARKNTRSARGFAAMSQGERRSIARKGGQASHGGERSRRQSPAKGKASKKLEAEIWQ